MISISEILNFQTILICFLGTFIGIVIGALPGLTPTMGVALFLPFGAAVDASPAAVLAGMLAYGAKVLVVMVAASIIENAVMRVRYKLLGRYTWFVTGIALLSLVFLVIGI